MFGLIKKMFMRLLISIVNASNHTMCVLLNNQKYMKEFHYYPFAVTLDRSVLSCNTFNHLYNKRRGFKEDLQKI